MEPQGSLIAMRTWCRQHLGLCGSFALGQLPLGGGRRQSSRLSRAVLLPVDFRKESQHVGSEVVTVLLTHKRYSVSEAMVSVKYPRASSVLPGSL